MGTFFIANEKNIVFFQRYFTRKKLYFFIIKIDDEEDSDYEIFSRRINCVGANFYVSTSSFKGK